MERFLLLITAVALVILVVFVQKGFNEVIKGLEAIHEKLGKPPSGGR
jgi:uncharacterized protein YoxC